MTEAFTFVHSLRVRWAEVDPQGIVFNANYFVFADVAFTEYQRAIGMPYPAGLHDEGADLFAVAASATYRASARYDDVLAIGVRAARLGRSSASFEVAIERDEAAIARLELTYVAAALGGAGSMPLPERFRGAIERYERVAPAREA